MTWTAALRVDQSSSLWILHNNLISVIIAIHGSQEPLLAQNNIKNQKEVCGYMTDLTTAYSGKILDTCPKNPEYDGDKLNKASICSLPKYYNGYKQMILNEVADKKMDKLSIDNNVKFN